MIYIIQFTTFKQNFFKMPSIFDRSKSQIGSKAGSKNEGGSEQDGSEAGSVTPSAPPAELVEVGKHSVKGQTCL